MALGEHPRRLSAEDWAVHRFADVVPVDGEPTDPENCPDAVTLCSYALHAKRLVLSPAVLHIIDCPRCTRQIAEIRQMHKVILLGKDKKHIRRLLFAIVLMVVAMLLFAAYHLLTRAGWFNVRTAAVPEFLGRAGQQAYASAGVIAFAFRL